MIPASSGEGSLLASAGGRRIRHGSRRRLWRPVRPADRPPGPRGARLLRDRAPLGHRQPRCRAQPEGIILSGGPKSVYTGALRVDPRSTARRPGARHLLRRAADRQLLGGEVAPHRVRRVRPTELASRRARPCCSQWPERQVWMSHGDSIVRPRGLRRDGSTARLAGGGVRRPSRALYGVQFHPEVIHTEHGTGAPRALSSSTSAAAARPGRTARSSRTQIDAVRAQVGEGACCARSRAASIRRSPRRSSTRPSATSSPASSSTPGSAQGRGRAGGGDVPRQFGVDLMHVDAARRFLRARGRHRSRAEAQDHRPAVHRGLRGGGRRSIADADFLVQGTLYPGRHRVGHRPRPAPRSSRTTTSAACRRTWASS